MSYILEALKKSEQERELGRVPGLVTAQEIEPARGWPRWFWPVTAVLVLNVVLLVLLLFRGGNSNDVQPVEMARAPAQVITTPIVHPEPPADSPAPPQVTAVVPPPPVQQTASPEPPAPESIPPEQTAHPSADISTAPASVEAATANGAGSVVFAERPLDELDGVELREAATLPVAQPAPEADEQIPLWQELPSDVRATLPAIELDVHVYSEEPADRFVLINLQKYREGDRLEEGPRLEAITPNGVVLSSRGIQFRINTR